MEVHFRRDIQSIRNNLEERMQTFINSMPPSSKSFAYRRRESKEGIKSPEQHGFASRSVEKGCIASISPVFFLNDIFSCI